jgi:hypothetical protein
MPAEHAPIADSPPPPIAGEIPSGDARVRAVRRRVAERIAKLARQRDAVRDREPDLFAVGFGLLSVGTGSGRGQGCVAALVRASDWAPVGCVMYRARRRRGDHPGYMRAEFLGGDVFEAYCAEEAPGVTGLHRNGRPIGCWRSVEYTCEGFLRQPLVRELWAGRRRLGWVDSALLGSGAAVLELEPEGSPLIPLRIRRTAVMSGNPIAELIKATPLGRRLGPRRPNLDLVLAPQAGWLADPGDVALVFAATLSLRTMEGARAWTGD